LVPPDHDPSGVNAASDGVSDEHVQHLCDATSGGGRTDVPHRGPGQCRSGPLRGLEKVAETGWTYEPREALWGEGRYDDFAELFHSFVVR
jgi:hypothetical protein